MTKFSPGNLFSRVFLLIPLCKNLNLENSCWICFGYRWFCIGVFWLCKRVCSIPFKLFCTVFQYVFKNQLLVLHKRLFNPFRCQCIRFLNSNIQSDIGYHFNIKTRVAYIVDKYLSFETTKLFKIDNFNIKNWVKCLTTALKWFYPHLINSIY